MTQVAFNNQTTSHIPARPADDERAAAVAEIAGLGTSITYRSTASPRYEVRSPRLRQPSVEHLRTQVSVRVSVARPAWEKRYRKAVIATDLIAIGLSELMHQVWGARAPSRQLHVEFLILEFAAAVLILRTVRAWDATELGRGPDEYTRVFRGFLWLALLVGVAGLAVKEPSLRPYAFGVTPIALVLAVAGRALQPRTRTPAPPGSPQNPTLAGRAKPEMLRPERRSAREQAPAARPRDQPSRPWCSLSSPRER